MPRMIWTELLQDNNKKHKEARTPQLLQEQINVTHG